MEKVVFDQAAENIPSSIGMTEERADEIKKNVVSLLESDEQPTITNVMEEVQNQYPDKAEFMFATYILGLENGMNKVISKMSRLAGIMPRG